MSDIATPSFDHSVDPTTFTVGEGLDADGNTHLVLGFEDRGMWRAYRLAPTTAITIVQAMSAWLDAHAGIGENE